VIDYTPGDLWIEFPYSAQYMGIVPAEKETTQEKIVVLLRTTPRITRKALAQAIGITADGIKYHLDKLKVAGKIRHYSPTKSGRWEVTQ